MLNRLHIRNFTVFAEADFEFGPGLNVIVGTNGTGKSHVLKVGYAFFYNLLDRLRERRVDAAGKSVMTESPRTSRFSDNLMNVFQLVSLPSEVVRRGNYELEAALEATITYSGTQTNSFYTLNHERAEEPSVIWPNTIDLGTSFKNPVFIPAKEVLIMGWLLPLYERREIPIDRTYPDLLRLLMGPPLRLPEPAHIVEQLQQLIGGKVEEEGGRFYLSAPEQPRMEMNLVAEGMRKFATLYKLLANGTLTPETTLFWDEPEANLNPALLKEMAAVLAEMARAGFQIILATHSLFLLKELHILSRQDDTKVRYFGLSSAAPGEAVTVTTADNLELLPGIVALDAELEQSERFQRVLDQEDADRN